MLMNGRKKNSAVVGDKSEPGRVAPLEPQVPNFFDE
jgi:hypothetical protein